MSRNLVAPRYEPARAYRPPKPAPFNFGVDTLSIEELMGTPATRAITLKYARWIGMMANTEAFQPYLSIFTVRDIAHFLPMDVSKSIAELDAALKSIPQSKRPANVR